MPPLISVCVPTYNGSEFLRECLDSLLVQTFTNFEVLIVDDCSSDATVAIAQDYEKSDSRVRVFKNESNLGLVKNWNRCIELAQGEWIKFVFQDDLIVPTCLEKMVGATKPESAMVFCRRDFIFEEGVPKDLQEVYLRFLMPEKFLPSSAEVSADDFCIATVKHFGRNFVGEPTAVMLHRTVFERFGNFNKHLIQWCDWEFWTRVASNTGVVYVPEVLATFRVHRKSTTNSNQAKRDFRQELDLCIIAHDFLDQPVYGNLRRVISERQSPTKLARLFTKTTYYVWIKGQRESSRFTNLKPTILLEWQTVGSLYPRLLSVPTMSSLNKLYYLLIRRILHIRWQITELLSNKIKNGRIELR